jgi:hypothetical protein
VRGVKTIEVSGGLWRLKGFSYTGGGTFVKLSCTCQHPRRGRETGLACFNDCWSHVQLAFFTLTDDWDSGLQSLLTIYTVPASHVHLASSTVLKGFLLPSAKLAEQHIMTGIKFH